MLLVVFVLSMFLSSALLFLVEPMIAKMLLPMLGGTPSVWNTCLLFFQAMLLVGYLYAHASSRWLARRTQIMVHLGLVLLPIVTLGVLPLHLPAGREPPAESSPVIWVLSTLLVSVGLPFFILSSTAPILQRWFAYSGHTDAADPYFLYAASNAGSLSGLLAYPLLVEPLFWLRTQTVFWSAGYGAFIVVIAACALFVWGKRTVEPCSKEPQEPASSISTAQRIRWVALAFVPSSLVLGVTTSLTTDVPAIPLFWVLPLVVYLVSFIIVFAKRPPIQHAWIVNFEPLPIVALMFLIITRVQLPFAIMAILYLFGLFAIAMACHGELAQSRPAVTRLTEFYLWISFGGVLGGIFNAILAPLIFRSVTELPLVLLLAAILRNSQHMNLDGSSETLARRNDWLHPLALGMAMISIITIVNHFGITHESSTFYVLLIPVFFYCSVLWCLTFAKRRWRFIGGLVVLLLASSLYDGPVGRVIHIDRSYFGVSRVSVDVHKRFRLLFSGGTMHGAESLDPAYSREPLTYYTKTGPAGQIFHAAQTAMPKGDWAIVGLGAGSMACYLQPGQTLTYYEIDPVVVRIAENPRYFRLLSECAPDAKIVLGDARLRLRSAPDAHYGLIVLDAFSGDSIPIHLITREALAVYQQKLAANGMLAFHISNSFMDLTRTLGLLAQDAHLACLVENDTNSPQAIFDPHWSPSTWVVMSRSADDLKVLTSLPDSRGRWLPIPTDGKQRVWTDDYSNLLSVMHFR